jgi:lysozyme
MEVNKAGRDLIKKFEGCKLKAYKCPAGLWTISWGLTFYPDGTKVKEGDVITQQQAEDYFNAIVDDFAKKVNANPKDKTILAEFKKWTRANGEVLKGLVRRRDAEAKLYEQL